MNIKFPPLFLPLALPVGLLCLGFAIALAAAVSVEMYEVHQRITQFKTEQRESILGLRGFSAYLIVESFDPERRTLIGYLYSIPAGQLIRTKMELSSKFYMERRNATIENGMIVGASDVVPTSVDELKPGVRALATITSESGKPYVVNYILIGDPFPRP